MMPVHTPTHLSRAGEARKGSLETLIGLPGLCKRSHHRLVRFCGPVARCRVSGSAKQKWSRGLVTLV